MAGLTYNPENKFRPWYMGKDGLDISGLARDTFTEALGMFSSELTKDEEKIKWITDARYGSLEEVLAAVCRAQDEYTEQRQGSKIREALNQVSEKLHFYSGIMDVMVQHHPEYTSLAWGAMKFLLLGVVNHQKLFCRLAAGLCKIADILPRAEFILQLYPTPHIRQTIAKIYAYVIRFLIRALHWYQEGKVRHMVHSITRPSELRYDDLLSSISALAQSMTELASTSSHAEQRDMHYSIQQQSLDHKETKASIERLAGLVLQMQETITTEHAISASARIEFRQRLSEVQLVQFMGHITVDVLPDPIKTFQGSIFLRQRRRPKPSNTGPPFWLDPKVQKWNQSQDSSLVMIKGTWKLRFHIQDFSAKVIAYLRNTKVPVIWALKSIDPTRSGSDVVSAIDLIKYLITQLVRTNTAIQVDAALTPCLASYLSAKTEVEWMNILASLLAGIPVLYIVLDVEVLGHSVAEPSPNFWPTAFHDLFSNIRARNIKTLVKVVLLSYGSSLLGGTKDSNWRHLVVPVGGVRQAKGLTGQSRRKAGSSLRGKISNVQSSRGGRSATRNSGHVLSQDRSSVGL